MIEEKESVVVAQNITGEKRYKVLTQEFNYIEYFTGYRRLATLVKVKYKFLFFWITIWEELVVYEEKEGSLSYNDNITNAVNQAVDIYRLLTE